MPPSTDDDTETGPLGRALDAKTERNADASAAGRGALMEGDEVKFNARMPENLRDAFSDLCESEGRSMSWVVKEWMRQAVEEGETGL